MKTLSFTLRFTTPVILGLSLGTAYAATEVERHPPPAHPHSIGSHSMTHVDSHDPALVGERRDASRRQQGDRSEPPTAAVEAEIDPVLGPQASAILNELQRVYALNPKEDLGEGIIRHLKGTKGWDDYLTDDVGVEIAAAREGSREAITSLGAAFKSGNLPLYTYDLTLKLLVEGARRHSASAIYTLSQIFGKGFGPIVKNSDKERALYDTSITIRDPSVKELRQWLELPALPLEDE